ncbi:hypothetical protein TELCIR_10303 [Teladorsagia circumcincta]|uniref:SXP/RAL-2 family protein Ani s 5-like cation-binding domain-containing protein n=1 Tax=Teladorsagia circumcincta TaxID=45464 RepID=A0A2G9UDW6_TELCI|nr:hypothetical protein TELCIR_10303 [Teladorsagia circumcincta]
MPNMRTGMRIAITILAVASVVLCRPTTKGCDMGRSLPPPSFLRNLSFGARNEYHTILFNRNGTLAQQKQNIVIWAQKYGIERFESNLVNLQNQIKQNVTDLISDLSMVLEQYYSIMENNDQTRMEQMRVLKNLSNQYPEVTT